MLANSQDIYTIENELPLFPSLRSRVAVIVHVRVCVCGVGEG